MTSPKSKRLLLIADPRQGAGEPAAGSVRRYRLARLRLDERDLGDEGRFEHLKRVYE